MKTFFTAIILLFALSCRAQITGPRTTDTLIFYTPFSWVNSLSLITPTLTGNYVWQLPDGNGTGTGFFTNDGTGVTSWTALSGLGADFILNQFAGAQASSNFWISSDGKIGNDLDVLGNIGGNTEGLSGTLQVAGVVTLTNTASSSNPNYTMLMSDYLGNLSTPTPPAGGLPIGEGVGNLVTWAVPTAGNGITITPGTGTLKISSDIDSVYTAGAGIDFIGSTAGNLHINSHADSTGAMFVLNQTATSQTPGGFYIRTTSPITSTFEQALVADVASSSTASVSSIAISAVSTGVNTGTSSKNIALQLGAANGTLNYDIYGDFWNVDNTGTLTLGTPLTVHNGGTGYAVSPARFGALITPDPTGYTRTAPQHAAMMGLGSTATITPATSGNVTFVITGTVVNSTGNQGTTVQMRYGTGTAPANGVTDAGAGTAVGSAEFAESVTSGAGGVTTISYMPFSVTAYVTGLAISTAVWFDVSLTPTANASMSSITSVYVMAIEE